jgi:DNA-binding CsgD family transcriptional regulator
MLTDELFYGTKLFHNKLSELLHPLKQYLGVTQGDYIKVHQDGSLINIHTDYKWMERYLEKGYYKNDPSFVHPNNASNGFAFLPAVDDELYKNSLLKEAIEEFDFHHSFVYIEKTKDSYTMVGFGTDKNNHGMPNKVLNSNNLVKKIIKNIIKQIILETNELEEKKVDLIKFKGDLFYKQPCLLHSSEEEEHKKIKILQNIGLMNSSYNNLELVKLSSQEINCLRIYMENYNIKYIAKKLNITLNTSISYIENIKKKLNCHTKEELLQKAEFLKELGKI